jgi:hypothetical protein
MSEQSPEEKSKKVPLEIRRLRMLEQVQTLARKLKNTATSHREAAYWEQLEEDMESAKKHPLA